MNANEAPEKIILSADKETGKLYDEWVIRDLTDNIKIEYTRTDAFIEKACDWFRRIDYDDSIPPFETTEEFVEGFKKAMKL